MFIRLVLIFMLSLALSPAKAAGPYGSIRVGSWSGGAYTNDSSGAFSHCAAAGTYKSGIGVIVALGSAHNWNLGFTHQAWQLTPGENFPITLTFDGREQFNVFGNVQNPTFVVVQMPQNSSLLSQFRKSNGMTAFAKGNTYQFDLTSTSQLMPVLANCVERMNRGGIRAAGDFSVGAAPSTAQPAPAQASDKPTDADAIILQAWLKKNRWMSNPMLGAKAHAIAQRLADRGIRGAEQLQQVEDEIVRLYPDLVADYGYQPAPVTVTSSLTSETAENHKLEAMEIATNFILKSALQNPRVLSRTEIPATLVSDGAAWKSEEAHGSVKIISGDGNPKGIDVASAIATADSKECKGKFMTGRAADLVDSDVVFRGFSICEDTERQSIGTVFCSAT